MAPSQPTAAVAGVQLASRQHNSLVPFFQVMPLLLTQLSTVWALAVVASAAVAINIANLFILFMVLLGGKNPQQRCEEVTGHLMRINRTRLGLNCATAPFDPKVNRLR
jgi:hypothetical protein